MEFVEVRTALASQEHAQKIADTLVCKRLAASAQVSGPIASLYWWKGKMTSAQEWIVTAKTRRALYKEVEQVIKHLHPYEEPGIIAIPIIAGSASYFSWISQETSREESQRVELGQAHTKAQLIQAFDEAYEKLIRAATVAKEQGVKVGEWGPREVLAHIAGWAVFTTKQIPRIIAGLPPVTYDNDIQHAIVDDDHNSAIITILGDQSFEQVTHIAHQTHQKFVQMLTEQDDNIFVPSNYVYERVKRVIDHHAQHAQELEAAIGNISQYEL